MALDNGSVRGMLQWRYPKLVAGYASYHRDLRNRITHFLGIPILLVANIYILSVPLLRLDYDVLGLPVSVALGFHLLSTFVWALFDPLFGLSIGAIFAPFLWLCVRWTDALVDVFFFGVSANVCVFVVLGIVGWSFQLVGHVLEGRRPAFTDNFLQGFMGATFLLYEVVTKMGFRAKLAAEVEQELRKLEKDML
tara:strand:- start:353 stop:934 length:582 start_codon:yes stop_codon:yes gene_type:complete